MSLNDDSLRFGNLPGLLEAVLSLSVHCFADVQIANKAPSHIALEHDDDPNDEDAVEDDSEDEDESEDSGA